MGHRSTQRAHSLRPRRTGARCHPRRHPREGSADATLRALPLQAISTPTLTDWEWELRGRADQHAHALGTLP
jgi:hypothetical protein